MIANADKRAHRRTAMQCPVSVRDIVGGPDETAELLDLSAGGVRFVGTRARVTGTQLHLTLRPPTPITPPLHAEVSVLRCLAVDDGFDIAASIVEIAPVGDPAGH